MRGWVGPNKRARRQELRGLAIADYWTASTPREAEIADIISDLFAPDVSKRRPRYQIREVPE
jgi:hypothetical protein